MVFLSKNRLQQLFVLLFTVVLTACGSSSSTTTTTTTSTATTVYYAHNLVFRDGVALSTGYNAYGQLGNGTLTNTSSVGLLALTTVTTSFNGLATGGNHSVGLGKDGNVYTWGNNEYGQLGNGTVTNSSTPALITGVSGVKAVAAGAFHTLALQNDGKLFAWGRNTWGQLGSAAGAQSTPLVISTPSTFVNISSIAANANHSLALANGKVWAWGQNGTGQLGIDPNTAYSTIPAVVADFSSAGFSSVAAGGAFSYAVARDGTLWAWGNNASGQLGNNSIVSTHTPVQVRTFSGVLQGVVQAAAGVQHGLALLANGEVWAWGFNRSGQLGNNTTVDSLFAIRVPGLGAASEIRAFGSSSMAKVDGSWYVWGDSSYGQLGIGTTGTVKQPLKMLGF